jgi:predicted oxidoreductase
MVDGSFDYMQLNKIRPMSWNPLDLFWKDIPQTHRLQKILATLVSKYHVGADTIFTSWVLNIPLKWFHCRNGKRNQNTIVMKAVELDLEKEDWFAWAESMGEDVP